MEGLLVMAEEKQSVEQLQREKLVLEMELVKEQLEQLRAKREARKRAHGEQEKTLEEGRRLERIVQRNCSHRKGGKGDDLKNNRGSDPNGSFADQQMPNSQVWRMCTRCFALWKPGDKSKTHPSGIGYEQIMQWPTDNSPAGSVQFRLAESEKREGQRELATVSEE